MVAATVQVLALFLLVAVGCSQGGSNDCSDGTCTCPQGSSCAFSCGAPPCHAVCGSGSTCSATCANGECTCQAGATCSFSCGAPPCHVTCAGQNPHCDGACADGSCTCGADSTCHFRCEAGPCHTICPSGASCVVECPNAGVAGTQDCDIVSCAAGTPTTCPDGRSVVCGAPCPSD